MSGAWDPCLVRLARIGSPAGLPRVGEVHVTGRAAGVVGGKDAPRGALVRQRLGDRRLDAVAGHIGDLFVDELRRVGAANTLQVAAVEPLAGEDRKSTRLNSSH